RAGSSSMSRTRRTATRCFQATSPNSRSRQRRHSAGSGGPTSRCPSIGSEHPLQGRSFSRSSATRRRTSPSRPGPSWPGRKGRRPLSETKLQRLCQEQGQSPWLDNLKRGYITSGELKQWVERGIRGITSNPTIFAKAIEGGSDYDEQFQSLVKQRTSVDDAYWDLVIDDIAHALQILRPVHDASGGEDGFVS